MGNKMKGMAFSEPMILALLNTKPNHWPPVAIDESKPFKSQTRREHGLKDFNKDPDHALFHPAKAEDGSWIFWYPKPVSDVVTAKLYKDGGIKPRYQIGEIVYVKEAWAHCQLVSRVAHRDGRSYDEISDGYAAYKADGFETIKDLKDHTRIMCGLEFTDIVVKNNRWQSPRFMPAYFARMELEIKAVRAELLQDITEEDAKAEGVTSTWLTRNFDAEDPFLYRDDYARLWTKINGSGSWDKNPWVFVYEFARAK